MTINPTSNKDLFARLRRIESRIESARLGTSIRNASIQEGYIQFTDENEIVRIQIGFNDPDDYEICFWDDTGTPLGCIAGPAGGGGMPPGGWIEDVNIVSNNHVLTATEQNILVDTSLAAGGTVMTLPSTHTTGKVYSILDIGWQCESKPITVVSADGDLIGGQPSYTLNVNGESITLLSAAGNWHLK